MYAFKVGGGGTAAGAGGCNRRHHPHHHPPQPNERQPSNQPRPAAFRHGRQRRDHGRQPAGGAVGGRRVLHPGRRGRDHPGGGHARGRRHRLRRCECSCMRACVWVVEWPAAGGVVCAALCAVQLRGNRAPILNSSSLLTLLAPVQNNIAVCAHDDLRRRPEGRRPGRRRPVGHEQGARGDTERALEEPHRERVQRCWRRRRRLAGAAAAIIRDGVPLTCRGSHPVELTAPEFISRRHKTWPTRTKNPPVDTPTYCITNSTAVYLGGQTSPLID